MPRLRALSSTTIRALKPENPLKAFCSPTNRGVGGLGGLCHLPGAAGRAGDDGGGALRLAEAIFKP